MTDRRRATIGILFGILLSAMDSTIVGTALPTIISHFGHVELYFLPISISMIVSTVSVPVFGRLSDLYGRKRFHFIGIFLITLGSVLCSQAWSIETLIAFRCVQTLGVGALMPLSFTMIADLYPLEQRAKMQGSISGVWGLAALMGPVLGGWITQHMGWPYVFLVPLPLGLISLLIIQRVWVDAPRAAKVARPDFPGALLLVLASAALLGGLSQARFGWISPVTFGLFAGSLALGLALAYVERRSSDPFMAVDLFRRRLFWTGTLCSSLMGAVMFIALSYLPLYVQSVLGGSPTKAGMVLSPMMLAWVTCSALAGFLLMRVQYRSLAICGTLLSAVGFYLLGRMEVASTWGEAGRAAAVVGAGLGLVMAPLLIAAQNSVGPGRLGAATSLTQFSRAMMGAIGVAIAGAAMSSILTSHGFDPDQIVNPELRKKLDPATAQAMRGLIEDSMTPVFRIGLGAAVLAFLAALLLPAGRARDLRSAEAIRTPDSRPE